MSSREAQSDAFLNSDALNDDFFIDIVERKLKISREAFKLRLVFIAPATGKNENYVSVVYRARINIELIESNQRQFVDVIVKALLSTLPELKEWSVFPRERFMYEEIIENFEEFLREKADEEIEFGPKCIKVETDPYEIIVLDDLKAEGYEMVNRKVGVDEIQTKLVLEKLAKFHAASAVRYQKEGVIKQDLDRNASMPRFDRNNPFYAGFIKSHNGYTKIISEIEELAHISGILSKWKPEVRINSFFTGGEAMRCGFRILNHGDDWVNNMMFKIDENGVTTDVKFLDFQMSYWGSPAGDLFYFLISSVRDEIKVEKFDDFIQYYHEKLVQSLKKLNYEQHIPTLSELQIDLLDKRACGASSMTDITFVCKYDSDHDLTMEDFMNPDAFDEEMIYRIYKNDNFLNAIKLWLPFMYKRGFLDPVEGEYEEFKVSKTDITFQVENGIQHE